MESFLYPERVGGAEKVLFVFMNFKWRARAIFARKIFLLKINWENFFPLSNMIEFFLSVSASEKKGHLYEIALLRVAFSKTLEAKLLYLLSLFSSEFLSPQAKHGISHSYHVAAIYNRCVLK